MTQDEIIRMARECFEYKDGHLLWKKSKKLAGSLNKDGYVRVQFCKSRHQAHRVVFALFNDFIPKFIDHINGNKSDNRIENLRPATKTQNGYNRKLGSDNKSGVKGVCWQQGKWIAGIKVNGKRIHLGYFDDIAMAEKVVIDARHKYHGEFANHVSS